MKKESCLDYKLHGFTHNVQDHPDSIVVWNLLQNRKEGYRRCLKLLKRLYDLNPSKFMEYINEQVIRYNHSVKNNPYMQDSDGQKYLRECIEFYEWIHNIETIQIDSINDTNFKRYAAQFCVDFLKVIGLEYKPIGENVSVGGDISVIEEKITPEELVKHKKGIEELIIKIFNINEFIEIVYIEDYNDDDDNEEDT